MPLKFQMKMISKYMLLTIDDGRRVKALSDTYDLKLNPSHTLREPTQGGTPPKRGNK